jgi:metal-dependent amidase/aminoacylase/carboxypeptidase family protein
VTAVDGGTGLNVIPSSVTVKGTMRTFSAMVAARLQRRMDEVTPHCCFLCVIVVEALHNC